MLLAATCTISSSAQDTNINTLHISAIDRYRRYYTMLYHLSGADANAGLAYTLTMKDSVASCKDKFLYYTLTNLHGPLSTYGDYIYGLYRKENNGWQRVPFIDNLIFKDVGYYLSRNDSTEGKVSTSVFAKPLRKGAYSLHKEISFDLQPRFKLTADSILPTGGDMHEAFECRILPSCSDSIRMLFVNHTQNTCCLYSLPNILDNENQACHPLAYSGHFKAFEWMRDKGQIKPGEGILLVIPTTWNIKDIDDKYRREHFKSGQLAHGEYRVSTMCNIELSAEFRIQ